MFLFILFFAMMLSACSTVDIPVNNTTNIPYYARQSNVPAKTYISARNSTYRAGKGIFAWPVNGRVINNYGQWSGGTSNKGINIQSAANDTVHAASDGQVVFANHLKGWGQTLILAHSNNIYTVYSNLKSIAAKEGSLVRRGDSIGTAAPASVNSGSVLHFEVRNGHQPQNPMRYLS